MSLLGTSHYGIDKFIMILNQHLRGKFKSTLKIILALCATYQEHNPVITVKVA
jgi:hypothetical protein